VNGSWARYGNVRMKVARCRDCETESFVIDGLLACCGVSVEVNATREKVIVPPVGNRCRPSGQRQLEILQEQRNRCLYCENEFGTVAEIRGRTQRLGVAWDHFVPLSFSGNNRDENFVAACGPCNNLKTNRVFETVVEARAFVLRLWMRKGYRVQS
jgi:hypothetical protein